jgi:mannose-6-phosphate isomerase-like protein (cupin superfamily)
MANDSVDLLQNYLLLEPDGTTALLPGGRGFWNQLMSGSPTDAGIQQLMNSPNGRLLSTMAMNADWTSWEMHPAGDEILIMLEGKANFVLEMPDGLREVFLTAGRMLVVPRGVWHTAKVPEPSRLLAITAGAGSQHRSA